MSERGIQRRHRRLREKELGASRPARAAAGAVVALGSTVLFADGATAATFEVTSNADSGTGSLRDAVDQANASSADDTITFASSVTGTITLTSGQLYVHDGGGLEIQGPGADQLTISGNNASRIVFTNSYPAGVPLLISGLTLTGGNALEGGAVMNEDQHLTIRDSVLTGNAASSKGGAVWSDGFNSSLTIEGTEISGNTAGIDGGGIYNEDTTVGGQRIHISDSVIKNNTATDDGGGIYLYDPDGDTLIEDTTISGNDAGDLGGGIYLYDTDSGGAFEIDNSTVSDNSAGNGGGIYLYGPDGPTTIENTTIAGNQTTGSTGGLTNSRNAGMTLDGVTIASNQGAGLTANTDPVTLKNSIVADNAAADVSTGATTINTEFDLIENPGTATINVTTPGSMKTGVDPALGPLADNGGPTETLLPGPSSPALDAANTSLTEDQRGLLRPVDLTKVAAGPGNQSDMGAVEVQAIANTAPPAISGQAKSGQTLSASQGTWSGNPTSFHYQWLRCDAGGSNCTPVGTDAATYALTDADAGSTIRVDVSAENGYTEGGPERSAATAQVASSAVIDPFLEMSSPQVQKGGTIKLEVVAGAGEQVRVHTGGKIFVNKGNAVQMQADTITSGQRVTIVLKAKNKDGNRRIKKALKNGRKVEAKINASLTNDAGQVYSKLLTAKLKRG
ncbi:MAG: right-handed parallel beta-helix repeat-containing protein [Solirubrobacterales bacterium]